MFLFAQVFHEVRVSIIDREMYEPIISVSEKVRQIAVSVKLSFLEKGFKRFGRSYFCYLAKFIASTLVRRVIAT